MKRRPARRPNASACPEYISSACPGAKPAPFHMVVLFVCNHPCKTHSVCSFGLRHC